MITGFYYDGSHASHGFLRARDGTFTSFDVRNDMNGTYPHDINPAGAVTGYYVDASNVGHGFLRAPDGTFTSFDPPGSISTGTSAINPSGVITGYYSDGNGSRGFLRARDGTFTSFEPRARRVTDPTASTRRGRSRGITMTRAGGSWLRAVQSTATKEAQSGRWISVSRDRGSGKRLVRQERRMSFRAARRGFHKRRWRSEGVLALGVISFQISFSSSKESVYQIIRQ